MTSSPLVSVIMPVFNAEPYLREAIDSVLAQTHPSHELICINDGSSDHSPDIIMSYGDKIAFIDSHKNEGIGTTRNKGLAVAHGDYIAFMDADDIWERNKLARQVEHMQEHPDVDLLFTYMQCFISPELSDEVKRTRACPTEPIPGHLAATALTKRNLFDAIGLFDPRWRVGEFIDWYARAKSHGVTIDILSDVLLRRRIHATNIGVRERPALTDYVKIAREALERKRQRGHS